MALQTSVSIPECLGGSPRQFASAIALPYSSGDASLGLGSGIIFYGKVERWRMEPTRPDRLSMFSKVGSFHEAMATSSGLGNTAAGIVRRAPAQVELRKTSWAGGIPLRIDLPSRKLPEANAFAVRARSKAKKSPKEAIPQRELLAQVRNRKKLTWLLREQELSQAGNEKIWPFWRKKRKTDLEARAVTIKIMQLAKRQQLRQVFDVLEEAEEQKSSIIIMNAVLEACVHCDDVDRAISIYREMLLPGRCGVDNITYGILLKGLGRAHRLDDAFELVEAIEAGTAPGNPVLSDVHINTLVNACVEAGDSLRARGVLLRYRSALQGSLSVLSYNLLIKGFSRSANPLEALKLKGEMLAHDIQPQRLTYNSLIFACVRGEDMEKAMDLFAEMKAEARRLRTSRLLPDVVTYTTLLKGFADAGNVETISTLVLEMKTSPTCVLDRVAYTSIIDAFIDAGRPQEGLHFFTQEMKQRAKVDPQLKPKAHVYLSLMRAFAAIGDMEVIRSLRQQMIPDSAGRVYPEDRAEADELLIEAAVNCGELGVAKDALRTMVGIKKHIPLSKRAHMAIVRLQALLGFSQDLFKPTLLKSGLSMQDPVESIMLPYERARPLPGNSQLKDVFMRFFKEDAIPIVDDRGACVGVVNAGDCVRMDCRLRDIMRAAPEVTTSTPVFRAVSLLLEPKTKLLVVVSSRTTYSSKGSSPKEVPLGFILKGTIFNAQNDALSSTEWTER